jgi:2-methylcitrate dehydratase PrpD
MTSPPLAAAEILAEFTTSLRLDAVPADVVEKAKLHFLDTLGCGLAAEALGVATQPGVAMTAIYGDGPATVLGSARGLPAPAAACANGSVCHALEFDDTHTAAITNVAAIVVPAALAAGEAAGASGAEVLTAIIAGSEIVPRLGLAAAPSFLDAGFHPAAICGVFGATAAAARIQSLDAATTLHALAITGSLASGIYEHFSDGSSTKVLHAGWAAQSGILAAHFAAAGLDGPRTVLEGRWGVFHSHFKLPGEAVLAQLEDFGERWESRRTAIRPYPVCYMSQSPLDALRGAIGGRVFAPDEIRAVRVSIPASGVPLVLDPPEEKRVPRSGVEARFSLPYGLAAMLVRGAVDVGTFTVEAIADPDVLAVAARVTHVPRDFPTFPAEYPGVVEIETTAGETLTAAVPYPRGAPQSPMPAAEIREKFRANARRAGLEDDRIGAIEAAIAGLDELDDLAGLSHPLRAARKALI